MYDVNRTEFVKQISEKYGYTKGDAEEIVDAFIDTVTENIARGRSVSFYGFGRFDILRHGGGGAVGKWAEEKMKVPPYYIPRFYPGKRLKLAVRRWLASRE